jgi:adenosine deaminase
MLASDLHIHLDGSLRDDTLVALSRDAGLIPATADADEFVRRLRFRPGMSLRSCLTRFDITVGLLQTRRALERVARELVCDCYMDGVRHAEIRFCPVLHTRKGLSSDDAVMSVLRGAERGIGEALASAPADRMSTRVIISVLQGMSEEEARELVDLAIGLMDFGVSGVDLAGDEALFDPTRYARSFARAAEAGLGVTVHAGEGGDAGNVAAARSSRTGVSRWRCACPATSTREQWSRSSHIRSSGSLTPAFRSRSRPTTDSSRPHL